MIRSLWSAVLVLIFGSASGVNAADPVTLFDGKSFAGWEGDTAKTWRIEDGVIAGGSLEKTVPRNEFLCSKKGYKDFELRLKYKLTGTAGSKFAPSGYPITMK